MNGNRKRQRILSAKPSFYFIFWRIFLLVPVFEAWCRGIIKMRCRLTFSAILSSYYSGFGALQSLLLRLWPISLESPCGCITTPRLINQRSAIDFPVRQDKYSEQELPLLHLSFIAHFYFYLFLIHNGSCKECSRYLQLRPGRSVESVHGNSAITDRAMFRIPWTRKDDGVWWFTEYRSRYCYSGRRVPRQSTRTFYWSLHERSYARPREEVIFSTVCPGSTVSRYWSSLSWRRLITAPSLVSHGVGVVLRSEHSKVKAGDHVYGMLGRFG